MGLGATAALAAAVQVVLLASGTWTAQSLATAFVTDQARGVEAAWRAHALAPDVRPPIGATRWGFAVVDGAGRTTRSAGGPYLETLAAPPDGGDLDLTRRDRTALGVRLVGVRRFEGRAGPHWIVVAAEGREAIIYLPLVLRRLAAQGAAAATIVVAGLLGREFAAARRLHAPLAALTREADALDASNPAGRLSPPDGWPELSALAEAVNRALARLRRALSLSRDFAADAAHEIRTPLTLLRMRLETLPPGDLKQRSLGDLDAVSRLVTQMLDLSRADALGLEQAQVVRLESLARGVVAQFAPRAQATGREIHILDLQPDPVRGHAEALARVLRNLLENAFSHSGGEAAIEVILGPGPRLAVRDHGRGLETLDPELLFRRFWRRRPGSGDGAGLGLGIAKRVVEAHGGVISAANARGGGAVFTCEFPRIKAG